MHSGKQTWKHQVKTSTEAELCPRSFPPSSVSFAQRIQLIHVRPVPQSRPQHPQPGLPLQCVWQPAITHTDEDQLIGLKRSSFFSYFVKRKECRKGPRMTSGGSSAERPGSS
ncbi:unnamed protein product [Pleuronectes platessa]|uniref:Uncharacterized protein n=1 Tax=Pleuronectes platessa TaxID=8262 RepID=A0A9N7UD59_PLEPL|nr:unnamed protein product [Pleuronectes platessa]